MLLGEYDSSNDRYAISEGVTEEDFIAAPQEDLQEGMPTTTSSNLASEDSGTVPGGEDMDGTVDGTTDQPVDPGMGVLPEVDAGTAEVLPEEGGETEGTEDYADDGEGAASDSLEGSPMEGLAR